jgi:hypothetical protein
MSKKLIAVASAAALALAGLVGVAPASATPVIAYKTGGAAIAAGTAAGEGAGTDGSPYLITVPAANALLSGEASVDLDTVVHVAVSSVAAGDTVSITTTGAVRVVDELFAASQYASVKTAGKTSLTHTVEGSDVTADLYVYTTSTAVGTFTVVVNKTASGVKSTATATKSIKGVAGPAYTLAATVPSAPTLNVEQEILVVAKDAFGNAIEDNAALITSLAAADAKTAGIGTAPTVSVFAWSATKKAYRATFTQTTAGAFAYILDHAGTSVAGLGTASTKGLFVVGSAGASDLAAKVAELQKIVDRKVTKKRFNTLAKKWNAAFPSQAVTLKK